MIYFERHFSFFSACINCTKSHIQTVSLALLTLIVWLLFSRMSFSCKWLLPFVLFWGIIVLFHYFILWILKWFPSKRLSIFFGSMDFPRFSCLLLSECSIWLPMLFLYIIFTVDFMIKTALTPPLYFCLPVCFFSLYQLIYLSVCLSTYSCLSIYLSIHLSVCLYA